MTKATKSRVKAQPTVVMESEVARKIRQHSRSSMKAEVCGVLIGSTENERTIVHACITGTNAAQGGTHVTFTQDTWEHIYKTKDRDFPDEKIVGWYHSHPGFGVFLSEHDLFIQENFFSSPNQIAWVYDPHTDEEGCFGWVDGKVEKLSGLRFGYLQTVDVAGQQSSATAEEMDHAGTELDARINPQEFSEAQAEPAWVRWIGRALSLLAVALLSATAGYIFGERQVARQVERELGPALGMCQQIVQHPIEACRGLLQEVSPAAEAPGGPANEANSGPQPAPAQNTAPKKGNDGKR